MMTETIFVADGGNSVLTDGPALATVSERQRKLAQINPYIYSGWRFVSWGTAPADSNLSGFTGFYFTRETETPDGFGAEQLIARLNSGLHAAVLVA